VSGRGGGGVGAVGCGGKDICESAIVAFAFQNEMIILPRFS